MKAFRLTTLLLLTALAAATLTVTGCSEHRAYYVAPGPPPPGPSLMDMAAHNGFRAGMDDGARDLYDGRGYRATHDRAFHDTPGYDPAFGPYGPYRDAFRNAYLRGYDRAFYRR